MTGDNGIIRLVAICGAGKKGGAENYFLRFVRACQNPAYGIEAIPFVRKGSWIASELEAKGIGYQAFGFGGVFDFFTKGQIRKHLKEIKPHATLGFMARAAKFTPKIDGIVNISRQGGFYQQKNFRSMDHVVVNAPDIIAHVVNDGFDKERVHLITNMTKPVDPGFHKTPELRGQYGLTDDKFIWLMAGRLHLNKNVDGALKAIAKADDGQHLFIVGEGPDEAELKALTSTLGVEKKVTFHGWVRNISEVAALADGWFYPSREEPLGSNTIDAWAHGIPIIAGNVSGPASMIENNVDGILVEPEDIDAMAEALNRVASDKAFQGSLIANGRKSLQSRHTEDVVMRQWYALFQKLIKTQNTP